MQDRETLLKLKSQFPDRPGVVAFCDSALRSVYPSHACTPCDATHVCWAFDAPVASCRGGK